ncbi:HAMP domain-containing sensor histidine kinase [Bradyrhizobium sp. AUGA SZCCT0182]|uniref:sensor histidine kinase n=1 Tax=Bradyrhizobium sp. AUGA SZCCT0182 TaxID=2807667 RepID=UPI001BACC9D5|nr:HAMP domain-containing sensor histidine kinase [Bradyrhizobium sp. AUGA SZCCT0182]MBR1232656.1 HAMP domain-containing histidine kinase [Bradyrhizobium sp. AUGA SZCCT0182]
MSARVPTAAINPGWPVLAVRLCVCLLLLAAMLPGPASGEPRGEPKRVLMLHSFGRDFLPWSAFARTIRTELEQQSPWPLELQEHNLLSARFNNPGPEAPFVDYLRSLYSGRPPDIVVSIGAPAARFVQKYRAQLFPETPMVLTAVEQRLVNRTDLTDNDTVIAVYNDFSAFFDSILQVLPDTQTIAVVIGASPLEKFWLEEVKREGKPFESRVAFVWYADLSFAEILKRASMLPPHTVLFWGLMSIDGAGVAHEGDLALRNLRAIANAPIFSFQEAYFGRDTVGGPMHSINESSERTVNAAIRILGGGKPADIKVQPIGFASPKYDWREMQRWGISESNLPPGSEILFREPGIWERYSWQLSLIACVILIQGGLIGGLLRERSRRRFAEVESRQRLAELAHLNRYSAVGELTTSIAHEINQPLGSILTNAETAELMLKSSSPNLDEVREILVDIRRDDQRASEVIRRLRSVLKKTPFEMRDIELNETVRQVIGFVAAMAHGRDIALKCCTASADLHVKGDVVQLQQVFLNLMINAMDAISEAEAKKREVSVTTSLSGASAEIRISDTGAGIATGDLKNVFDPFFTTKPQGMGMGLAIARTIVEAHHGQISAENQPLGGALFTIRLPIARDRSTSA